MKKLLALLLTILLLTITFASCNLDGTAGIFRQISQAKAPLDIRYKQLLGIDTAPLLDELYFWTAKGVEKVNTDKVKTTVIAGKNENLIQAAAYLKAPENKVLYFTNNEVERVANQIRYVDTTNLSAVPGTITVVKANTTSIDSELSIKGLYANSMILVSGKNLSGDKVFELLEYNGTIFGASVATFTMTDTSYDIHEIIQQTAHEQDATAPMIVSFVKDKENYIHYLVNPKTTNKPLIGFDDSTISNLMYDSGNDKTYVLTTNGVLFYTGPLALPIAKAEMKTSDKLYNSNSFAYGLHDSGTSTFHLVTKPSTKTSPLYVFTFPDDTIDGTGVTLSKVQSGYAKELSLATIVSSQVKSTAFGPPKTTTLLIATDEDGMFDIEIEHPDANKDISTNGSSSEGEGYTFP